MQQPEVHDHQWWLDVSVVQRVSSSKQTGDDNVLVHQPSTEVSQQGTVAQYHGGNDASEHTNETVFSPELSTSVDMAEKDGNDAVAATIFISIVVNRYKRDRKRNRNVFKQILYYLQTSQMKRTNFNQSQLFLSITCFRKSTLK